MNLPQIDLRRIIPSDRHSTVFQTFDALKLGDEFVLLVDHNPRPLLSQFKSKRPGAFTWAHMEEGPQVWKIRIGKISDQMSDEEPEEGCCGFCGTH